jgi:hypothetical protein
MAGLGGYLIAFGALSAVLSFFNYEFVLLTWIGSWGETVAWFIRAGIIALGWVLVETENRRAKQAQQPQSDPIS